MSLSSVLQAFRSKPRKSSKGVRKVRVGLVGAGRMGQNHARLLSQNPDADFVGIVDSDASRRNSLAKKWHTQAFAQAADLIGKAEAVVVAVPTPLHFPIGKQFLEAGVHCLIEKPLAATLSRRSREA